MKLELNHLDITKKYVMGVSGGPDSMALLDMLRQLGYDIVVCLVNYHKRKDSDLDYQVVKAYCSSYQLRLEYLEIFDYQQGNFQAQARKLRYDFFLKIAQQNDCEAVILAHHQDDFLETVLMQQARHMEDVLYGIPSVSNYHGLKVIRPAMNCLKEELVAYCELKKIDYRIDSSNLESDYTRNYYRNQVLCFYTKEMKTELYEKTLHYNQVLMAKQEIIKKWLKENCTNQGINIAQFLSLENSKEVLRYYLYHTPGMDTSRISKALVEECFKALTSSTPNLKINLPVNFVLIKEYDNMYVTKIKKKLDYQYQILDDQEADFGEFKISKVGDDRAGVGLTKDDFPLTIRTFQPGDAIELSYGRKKLSRLFIDAKIPSEKRKIWPIVLNSRQEIILVPKIAKNKYYLLAKPTLFVIQ